uniref:PHD-type zinc finger plants domain-containing protein n=1 Tax=Oryza punctata TaxID=4537 RepID=A0A0E0KR90_ORYPU
MASTSPSSSVGGGAGAGDVCCMCGDRGLPEELFHCRLCRVRLQHRYCSNLYPRATAYRRCNWCLVTEPGGGGHVHAVADKPTVRRKASSSMMDQETSPMSSEAERQRLQEAAGCSASRRAPDTGLGRPVKKQKAAAADEGEEAPGARAAPAKGNNGNKKAMQAAGKKMGVKVRVRRYKLLAEVISC